MKCQKVTKSDPAPAIIGFREMDCRQGRLALHAQKENSNVGGKGSVEKRKKQDTRGMCPGFTKS